MKNKSIFKRELETLINKRSMEEGSDTPDFILASYLTMCLELFNIITKAREQWYGRIEDPQDNYIQKL